MLWEVENDAYRINYRVGKKEKFEKDLREDHREYFAISFKSSSYNILHMWKMIDFITRMFN